MSKGTSTTSTEINPELLSMYKTVFSGAESAAKLPFQPYTDPKVAGFNPDDITAFDATRGMFGDAMGYNPRAELANMGTASLDISPYMNPYQTEVIDRAISDLDRARQIQIADSQDRAIGAGAFGGSRSAILEKDADRGYFDAVGRTVSDLRKSGFDTAAQLGLDDRAYRTGIQSGLLSDQYQTLGLLGGVGAMERAMQQQGLDANYEEFLRSIGYPDTQLDRLKSGVSFLPSSTNATTRQKTGAGDILGALSGLFGTALQGGYFK